MEQDKIGISAELIVQKFSNTRLGEKKESGSVIVTHPNTNNDIAELHNYFDIDMREWHIIIDNYPFPRKHYRYNFPITSIEQFHTDMLRLGLNLEWAKTVCVSCNKLEDCEGGNICSVCDKAELN